MRSILFCLLSIFCLIGNAWGGVGDGFNGEVFRPQLEYHTKDVEWTGWNKVWVSTAFLSFVVADTWSTYEAIESGRGVEGNPVFGKSPNYTVVVVSKVVVFGAFWLATEYLIAPEQRSDMRNILFGGLTVIGAGATAWNMNVGR